MNALEAKETIAAYLTGRRWVSRPDVEMALAIMNSDDRFASHLRMEMGLPVAAHGLCEAFRTRVAEFCDLSPSERSEEMSELLVHAGKCRVCHALYWEEKPIWKPIVGRDIARAVTKTLAEKISLVLSAAGQMLERGLGPIAQELTPIAATAGGMGHGVLIGIEDASAAGENPERKEWRLHDPEAACTFHLVIVGRVGRADLRCTIEGETLPARDVRIEITESQSRQIVLAGRLSDWQMDAIRLRPGSWLITLESGIGVASWSWNIPLEIALEPAEETNQRHAHES